MARDTNPTVKAAKAQQKVMENCRCRGSELTFEQQADEEWCEQERGSWLPWARFLAEAQCGLGIAVGKSKVVNRESRGGGVVGCRSGTQPPPGGLDNTVILAEKAPLLGALYHLPKTTPRAYDG